MKRFILWASLLVVTQGGQVSIVKGLDDKTCKLAACQLQKNMYCGGGFCDEEGNLIYPTLPSTSGTMCYVSPSQAKTVECLK